LGIAASNHKIPVPPSSEQEEEGVTYGIETFEAVVEGISFFTANLQGPPYALILEPAINADTYFPLEDNSMVTPASAIKALVEGGFVMSPGLPAKTGLLVSLGGKTTTLYVGTEPRIEFDTKDHSTYEFDTLESIQFHNVDRRALIKLE